jgi:hypothetical protein
MVLQRHGDDGWESATDQPGHQQFLVAGDLELCCRAKKHFELLSMQVIHDSGIPENILTHLQGQEEEEEDDDELAVDRYVEEQQELRASGEI